MAISFHTSLEDTVHWLWTAPLLEVAGLGLVMFLLFVVVLWALDGCP